MLIAYAALLIDASPRERCKNTLLFAASPAYSRRYRQGTLKAVGGELGGSVSRLPLTEGTKRQQTIERDIDVRFQLLAIEQFAAHNATPRQQFSTRYANNNMSRKNTLRHSSYDNAAPESEGEFSGVYVASRACRC